MNDDTPRRRTRAKIIHFRTEYSIPTDNSEGSDCPSSPTTIYTQYPTHPHQRAFQAKSGTIHQICHLAAPHPSTQNCARRTWLWNPLIPGNTCSKSIFVLTTLRADEKTVRLH